MIFNQQGVASGGGGDIEDVSSLFSFSGGDSVEGHMEIYAAWLDGAVSICGRIIDLDLDLGDGSGIVTTDSRFMPNGNFYDLSGHSDNQLVCEITPYDGMYAGSNLEGIYDNGDEIFFACTNLISEGDGFFTAYYLTAT